MRKQFWYFFFVGWVVMMIGACQTDTINPATVVPGNSIEDLMSQPFMMDMIIDGPDCYVDPLSREGGSDKPGSTELPCLGSVEVSSEGVSTLNVNFNVRANFKFNPMTCESNGFVKVEFAEPGYAYAFEIFGTSHLDNTLFTSDEVALPLRLIYSTEPGDVEFEGFLYIENPECLAKEQEGKVSRNAYITKTVPASNPINNS